MVELYWPGEGARDALSLFMFSLSAGSEDFLFLAFTFGVSVLVLYLLQYRRVMLNACVK